MTKTHAFKFDEVLKLSPVGIAVFNWQGQFEATNPAYCAIYGYSEAELLGQSITIIFSPDQHAYVLDRHRAFLHGKTSLSGEWEVFKRDGTCLTVLSHSAAIYGTDGEARRLVYVTDITERKRMEVQTSRLACIIQSSSDAIISKSLEGIVTSWNPAAQTMFGYTAQEMLGQNISRLLPLDRKNEHTKVLSRVRAGEHVAHYETVRRCKDGRVLHVSVSISPILDSFGRITGASMIARDISERIQMEEKLQQQRVQLQHIAHFDSLTDLPNRVLLSDRLRQGLLQAKRRNHLLAVLYLDLDGFKQINDLHGHAIGDAILLAVSRRILSTMRDADTLARIGGDEFVAVLTDVHSTTDCAQLLQRILLACAMPIALGEIRVQISASIGCTLYPTDNTDADLLIRHADHAMYRAKRAGKNRFHIFDINEAN